MQIYNDREFADSKNKIIKRNADSEGKVIRHTRKVLNAK